MKGYILIILFIMLAFFVGMCAFGCKEEKHHCPTEEEMQAIRNTNYAKSYHINNLYARIDSMQKRLMWLEDSIAFNAPIDWTPASVTFAPDDAGPYTPTKRDSVEWGLHGHKTEWIKP